MWSPLSPAYHSPIKWQCIVTFRAAVVLQRLLVILSLWYIGYILYNMVSIVSCLLLNDLLVIFMLANKFWAMLCALPFHTEIRTCLQRQRWCIKLFHQDNQSSATLHVLILYLILDIYRLSLYQMPMSAELNHLPITSLDNNLTVVGLHPVTTNSTLLTQTVPPTPAPHPQRS